MHRQTQKTKNRKRNIKKEYQDTFRNTVQVTSQFLEEIPETQSLWYETPEEMEQKIQWGKEKEQLLNWVKKQIERKLTPKERKFIEHYYFQGETLKEISKKFRTQPSSVSRTIRRGIKKLIQLTKNESILFHPVHMKRCRVKRKKNT